MALAISSIAAIGDFDQTNNCPASLATGTSCTITVTFKPTATGTRYGNITINDNANGYASVQFVPLTGTGTAPVAVFSASSIHFGNQKVGTSAAQSVALSNTGTAPLTINALAATADFAVASGTTCGTASAVAPGGSCTVNLTFTPAQEGNRTGSLTITDNSNGVAGSTQTVNLDGVGLAPLVAFSATGANFSGQLVGNTSAAQNLTLTSSGNEALAITAIAASGDFVETNTCGTSVAVGANCTISVTFKPTVGGVRTGAVTITDNAAGSPHRVGLTGTGQDFSVAPPSGSSTSATVSKGQTASYNLSVAPVGGLSGTLAFTCTGAPSEATCSVSPASMTASGTSASNITVSVSTTAASFLFPSPRRDLPGDRGWKPWCWVLLLGLILMAAGILYGKSGQRRRWGSLPAACDTPVGICFSDSCGLAGDARCFLRRWRRERRRR